MIAGPGYVGTAMAHAGLFGFDFDFFGDDDKSDLHHPRPGSDAAVARAAAGPTAGEAPTAKVGSAPGGLGVSETTAMRSLASTPEGSALASAPESVAVASSGGGGGGVPRAVTPGRPDNLQRVSSAPNARTVIIRRAPQPAAPVPAYVSPVPQSPVVAVPLAVPPPDTAEPEGRPAPAAPPVPSPSTARVKDPVAPGNSSPARIPDSFRIGYPEYLRSADTADMLAAALPGVAGIAGFTLVGAYAGYRQAKALQKALLAPVPTSVLL